MPLRRTVSVFGLVAIFIGASFATAHSQVWWPGPDYPAPDRQEAPEWLGAHKLNFSRWDGGPLENCKGMLSGWPYFNAPWPNVLDATNRWYDLETVDLIKEYNFNFIWVTFSVGYSIEQERHQWELLRPYVKECQRRGIRVTAYMSSCNLFVDDMLENVEGAKDWLLVEEDGEPVPYGAANYKKMGRKTRLMADVTHPGWKDYLKRRIDAAIELGVDAIEYDNSFWGPSGKEASATYQEFLTKNNFVDGPELKTVYVNEIFKQLFQELLAHARKKKPDMVMFANVHHPDGAIHRGCGIITTESGFEPGYYKYEYGHEVGSPDTLKPRYTDGLDFDTNAPFDPEMLITNIGQMRMLRGLDAGWKPILFEYGGRKNGHRVLNQFAPQAFQLAVAECNASLCSLQSFQEGLALLELYNRKPEVMKTVEAANAVHTFVNDNEKYFLGARFKADVAFVVDDRQKGQELVTDLVKENQQIEVIFEDRLTKDSLSRFDCVVIYDMKLVSDEALNTLVDFANSGGKFLVVGETGAANRWAQPRSHNPLAGDGPWERASNNNEAVKKYIRENTKPVVEVPDAPWVLVTLTEGGGTPEGGFVAHLVNYQKRTMENVRVRCPVGTKPRVLALSPGSTEIRKGSVEDEWILLKLGVYSMLVVEP